MDSDYCGDQRGGAGYSKVTLVSWGRAQQEQHLSTWPFSLTWSDLVEREW